MRFWRGAASLRSAGQPRRLSPHWPLCNPTGGILQTTKQLHIPRILLFVSTGLFWHN
jgi:hypothetical protein